MTGPFGLTGTAPTVTGLLGRQAPELRLVRMWRAPDRAEPIDVPQVVTDRLAPAAELVTPGLRVAVAVGSRGITDLAEVVAATVARLRLSGAEPFVVPAMGSHGGATADGQRRTLDELGVSEATVGAPVVATMDTVLVGTPEPDLRVFVDKAVFDADALLLINRVKSHTSFTGEIESGLAKMLAIGVGKQTGAQELHRFGPLRLERRIRLAAACVRGHVRVLGGLALVEDAAKRLRHLTWLSGDEIGGTEEAQLLVRAKQLSPRLPVSPIDVLIVDAMGKDRSGTGMDTKVIGRMMVRGSPEPDYPVVTNLVALSLTPESGGNATGVGLADFVSHGLARQVDLAATYANSLTAGLQGVQRAQVPITLATDRDAVGAAVLTAAVADLATARVIRIRDTLRLDDLMVSPALVDECAAVGFQAVPGPAGLFDAAGRITPWPPAESDEGVPG